MKKVFISYRREDTAGYAGRLQESLTKAFSAKNIFQDITNIKPGENFEEAIKKALASYDVVIILIGKQWATITDNKGKRRLQNPNDYVRLEVTAALNNKARVIPVLVRGAKMPKPEDLPDPLLRLVKIQTFTLSDDRWNYDIKQLVRTIGNSKLNFLLKQYSTHILSLILVSLLTLFLVSLWTLDWNSNSQNIPKNEPTENGKALDISDRQSEAKKSVLSLEKEISYLWGAFESIGTYDHTRPDSSRDRVEKESASLARRLENIQDNNLQLHLQILKYDAISLAFVMAASVESEKKIRTDYANNVIRNGNMALQLIEEAFDRAKDGGIDNQKVVKWIEAYSKKESILYILAVAHAIKVKDGDVGLVETTKKIMANIPNIYRKLEPFEKDRNLKWFLEHY